MAWISHIHNYERIEMDTVDNIQRAFNIQLEKYARMVLAYETEIANFNIQTGRMQSELDDLRNQLAASVKTAAKTTKES